ncbi:hypothetical protein JXA88_10655 [Candidatus Fermentibacteria bacterium]|nr:hypothetical protein [Candidatus Fermentibacteria bacterium]
MRCIADIASARIPGLVSLVLGGSFARGEGTFIRQAAGWEPYKDYDLFAVVDNGSLRKAAHAVDEVRQAAYEALGYPPYDEEKPSPGRFHIGLAVMSVNTLARLPHDLANVELKLTGQVVWGHNLLERIPADPTQIPPESGLRPVLNKLIGLVEQWGPWVDSAALPPQEILQSIAYDRAKATLDLVAALLLLRGQWTPGYAARNLTLSIAEENGPLLQGIGALSQRADAALVFKLNPAGPDPSEGAALWCCARDEALAFTEPLAASVLAYLPGSPLDGAQRLARHARGKFLRPFADQGLRQRGIPLRRVLAPALVSIYQVVENLRLGSIRRTHPLIRAWAAAWAWLAATQEPSHAAALHAWARGTVGSSRGDPDGLRDDIVRLFKASSTARRRKRSL